MLDENTPKRTVRVFLPYPDRKRTFNHGYDCGSVHDTVAETLFLAETSPHS